MKPIIFTLAFLVIVTASTNANHSPASRISMSSRMVSQTADVFGTFHVHRNGDISSLNWNVVSDEVSSFRIERSYDGEFFNTIDEVTPDVSKWNRYSDATVEPGIIYYRVIAIMNDGSEEASTTEVVKIVKHK